MTNKQKRGIWIAALALVVFFFGYSVFFRTYLDSETYLQMAYDYTGRDPTIIDWRYPDFEIINHKGRLTIHIIFHTTEDMTRGPIGLYIDPFKKQVVDEDPRRPARSRSQNTP